jgi:hypothetical protein
VTPALAGAAIAVVLAIEPWEREPSGSFMRAWRVAGTNRLDLAARIFPASGINALLGKLVWRAWAPFSPNHFATALAGSLEEAQRDADAALARFCRERVS